MLTPEMEDVIAASKRESFLQSYNHVVPMPAQGAQGWGGRGRVTLLGDAAHAMRTVAGQGANQAFEDCVALVRELTGESPLLPPLSSKTTGGKRVDLTDFSDVDERLRKFEATRLPRVRAIHANQEEWVSFHRRFRQDEYNYCCILLLGSFPSSIEVLYIPNHTDAVAFAFRCVCYCCKRQFPRTMRPRKV
jgi:hypothetical protein